MKICNKCKVAKPRSEFYCCRAALDGLQYKCKACGEIWAKANAERIRTRAAARYIANSAQVIVKTTAWAKANPERVKEYRIKSLYKLSPTDYAAMVVTQAGRCAICNKDNEGKILCVDHDHVTGTVRGLVCRKCNLGLGCFDDSYTIIVAATAYLKKWKTDSLI